VISQSQKTANPIKKKIPKRLDLFLKKIDLEDFGNIGNLFINNSLIIQSDQAILYPNLNNPIN